jgi:hypothetical protein
MGKDVITLSIVMSHSTFVQFIFLPLCCMCASPWQGKRVTCASAMPMCESGGNPALLANVIRCRPRTTGLHVHPVEIWKQRDTRLAAISHTSLNSLPPLHLQAAASPPGPQIMSLGVPEAACTLTGFSPHETGLLTRG